MAHRRQGNQAEQVLKFHRGCLHRRLTNEKKPHIPPNSGTAARLSSNRSANRPTDRFERSPVALGVLYCECFVMADSKRANTESRLRNTDRIVVMGTTGAGKTTLARQIAEALDMPHFELDYPKYVVMWRLFWRTISRGVIRKELWQGNREKPLVAVLYS